jgi:hypothetical protein
VVLSGPMRRAAKGRLECETERRWMERQWWRLAVIWSLVGGVRGGKREGRRVAAAVAVVGGVCVGSLDGADIVVVFVFFR